MAQVRVGAFPTLSWENGSLDSPTPYGENRAVWGPRFPTPPRQKSGVPGARLNHGPTPSGVPPGHGFVLGGCPPASELAGYYHRSLRD